MANRLKGEVEVALGEGDHARTVVFRLGINELITAQEALGYKEDDEERFLADIQAGKAVRTIRKLRLMVKQGLLRHQPETTDEQAGDFITELGTNKVAEVIKKALLWAMPEKEPAGSAPEAKGKGDAPSTGAMPS